MRQATQSEFSFLLAACQHYCLARIFEDLPRISKLSASRLLAISNFHQVLPQTLYLLRKIDKRHPSTILFEREFRRQREYTIALETILSKLTQKFLLGSIPHLSLSGLRLSRMYYQASADRLIRYLDFSFPIEQIEAVHEILDAQDFETESQLPTSMRRIMARQNHLFVYRQSGSGAEIVIRFLGEGIPWFENCPSFGSVSLGNELSAKERGARHLRLLAQEGSDRNWEELALVLDMALVISKEEFTLSELEAELTSECDLSLLLNLLTHYKLCPRLLTNTEGSLSKSAEHEVSRIIQKQQEPPCFEPSGTQTDREIVDRLATRKKIRIDDMQRELNGTRDTLRQFLESLKVRMSFQL